jgi:hypothetical protein
LALGDAGFDLGDAGFDLGDAGFDLGDAGFDLGDAGFDLGDAGFDLGDAGFDLGDAGVFAFAGLDFLKQSGPFFSSLHNFSLFIFEYPLIFPFASFLNSSTVGIY